jgi:hypothetical protein
MSVLIVSICFFAKLLNRSEYGTSALVYWCDEVLKFFFCLYDGLSEKRLDMAQDVSVVQFNLDTLRKRTTIHLPDENTNSGRSSKRTR